MRLCWRYPDVATRDADSRRRFPDRGSLGVVVGETVHALDAPPQIWESPGRFADGAFEALAALEPGEAVGTLDETPLGCPVLRPAQFLDFYAFEQHVKTARARRGLDVIPEWHEIPVYYNSNPTSLYGHKQVADFPRGEENLDYELEMACIIGKTIRNATVETARRAIGGYTILNDLSARARQRKAMAVGLGPAPGKDFGSALGPCLVTPDEIPDLRELEMRAYVNGEEWSRGVFGSIRYSFEEMIVYATRSRTLYPGDVIGSGTVGTGCGLELGKFLSPGDTVRLEIDLLGALETTIRHEPTEQA